MPKIFNYDSDSTDSDDSYKVTKPTVSQNKFQVMSSESEDEKRVVRSAKDKRLEEIQIFRRNLNNHKKNKDNSKIMADFEELIRLNERAKKLKSDFGATPKFFIRALGEIEDYIRDSWENKKDMNKMAAKSLTVLKQRVKKVTRDYEDQLLNYHDHPDEYVDSADEQDLEPDDEDAFDFDPQSNKPSKVKFRGSSDEEEEEDYDDNEEERRPRRNEDEENSPSSNFGSDDGSDLDSSGASSDSSMDPLNMDMYKDNPGAYFLKSTVEARAKEKLRRKTVRAKDKKPKKSRDERDSRRHQHQSRHQHHLDEDDEDYHKSGLNRDNVDWLTVGGANEGIFGQVDPQLQAFEKGAEITPDTVAKKLEEIMSDRGKTGISIGDQIYLLMQVEQKMDELHVGGIGLHAKVLICLITVLFDHGSKSSQQFVPNNKFQKALELFDKLFDLLENNRDQLQFTTSSGAEEQLRQAPFTIQGSIMLLVASLDDEYTKILRHVNGHEVEYIERLRDERRICCFIDRLCAHVELRSGGLDDETICLAYLRKVEHLYYKFDLEWAARAHKEEEHTSVAEMRRLCEFIYTHDATDRLRARAILCHIYHLALYGYWYRARDLMLMGNLQASIDHADQATMVLYNRAMVQLGLCAFRQAYIRDAHNALVDIVSSMRVRELLAQQTVAQAAAHHHRHGDRTTEEELRDRAVQVPYHMHINTDLLECVYLVSTMLLEIPMLAAHESDMRWRQISKAFHQALRIHDRATLTAPPESPRDHVIMAAKSMRLGNWRACHDFLFNAKMDAKIWNLFWDAARVKQMLTERVKEESLRSYMFMYSAVHDSISLDRLAAHFHLEKPVVYSIISKMVIGQELAASLEVPSDFLIMHKMERSRLQTLALQLADKVNGIVEMNEKLIDNRTGAGQLGTKSFQQYSGLRRQVGRFNQSVKFQQ